MKLKHFSAKQLAQRWNITEKTLEQWRWFGRGPSFIKIGSRVLYRLRDIERFEQLQMHHLADHIPHPVYAQISLQNQAEIFSEQGRNR